MSDDPYVEAINRTHAVALLDCGCQVPVIEWFGVDGKDCVPDEAIVCVCGDDNHGWFTVDLIAFQIVTVH